ncbi:hypothetical protein PybrP1_008888 [[Pythium] brassicae (nom. inval.)]|nr:hypothetical protein PybrP1_008888 [[Pythium] brassicae (nom. inval.)]
MYVTRRFLRSTMMPSEPAATATGTEQSAATATETARGRPSPSSSARAKRKSSADAMPVAKVAVASAAASAALPRKKKPSPRLSRAAAAHSAPAEESDPPPQPAGLGLLVDARDSLERWCEAKIIDLDEAAQKAFVHYVGWNARYDAWLSVAYLAAHGSHTGAGDKKSGGGSNSSSWDGRVDLFASAGDVAPAAVDQLEETRDAESVAEAPSTETKKKQKDKKKKDKKKKDKKKKEKKRTRRSRSADGSEHGDESGDDAAAAAAADDPEPRKRARIAEASGEAPLKKPEAKTTSAQPVRVAVATTDEASERKARRGRKAAVDMELHVETRKRSSKKVKRQSASSRSSSSKPSASAPKRGGRGRQSHPPPPPPPPLAPRSPVVLSETREKLAAIFRLRLQQRQHLEQLMSADAVDSGAAVETPPADAEAADAAAQDAYAHYHHAQQLQQFYYQQAMLATSADAAGGDAAPALQGGLVDPRVIQARVDALELQRRMQQQQLHDFYQHVAITRERNVQALAASHDFLAKSGHAWQQQQQQQQQQASSRPPSAAGERGEKPPAAEAAGAGCSAPTSAGNVLYEFVL